MSQRRRKKLNVPIVHTKPRLDLRTLRLHLVRVGEERRLDFYDLNPCSTVKVLIFSDIHANWTALGAVLTAESAADKILCLGDLVAYGPHPAACVQWAMQRAGSAWLLQGNHDRGLAKNEDPHCSPPYRHFAAVTHEFSRRMLTREMLAFLGSLKPLLSIQIEGARWVACHAAPSDPLYRYQHRGVGVELEIAGHPDFLFFGHTHWPMNRRFGKAVVVNPGSVGQPKDGQSSAGYAIWQDGKVTLRRAAYDVEETIRALAGTPLDSTDVAALTHVLRTGGELPLKSA